jgi:hypothetical protein
VRDRLALGWVEPRQDLLRTEPQGGGGWLAGHSPVILGSPTVDGSTRTRHLALSREVTP